MKTKDKEYAGQPTRAPLPGAKAETVKSTSGRKRLRKNANNEKFGYPVREAKKEMTTPLLAVDIAAAAEVKPDDVNDESNFISCILAQAFTRSCGADRVWIGRNTAYVAFPGEKITRRYEIDDHSRSVVEAWDRGEDIEEGIELRLKPPSPTNTRAAANKARKAYRRKQPKGVGDRKRKTNRKQRASDPLHKAVRNGNLVRWS